MGEFSEGRGCLGSPPTYGDSDLLGVHGCSAAAWEQCLPPPNTSPGPSYFGVAW